MKRPKANGPFCTVTTPRAACSVGLLGVGAQHNGIALTRDEFRAINKLYGFKKEPPNQGRGPQEWMQAGADRNALRHAECDGVRLLAWIAKYVPTGEDPLKHLIQAVVAAGWDVDPEDIEYAMGEGDVDPEEDVA